MRRALYTAEVTARGGRSGRVRSADGILDIDLRIPREMGGAGEPGSNPEQLFAAAYAACFESTLRAIARSRKTLLRDASITARVTLGLTNDRRYQLGVGGVRMPSSRHVPISQIDISQEAQGSS